MIQGLRPSDLYLQLTEELGECVQAYAKLERQQIGRNYTPKTYSECMDALIEELADVELCIEQAMEEMALPALTMQKKIAEYKERKEEEFTGIRTVAADAAKLIDLSGQMCEETQTIGVPVVTVAFVEAVACWYAETEKLMSKYSISIKEINRRKRGKLLRWNDRQTQQPKLPH